MRALPVTRAATWALVLLLLLPSSSALARPNTTATDDQAWIVMLEPGHPAATRAAELARAVGGRAGHIYDRALNGFQLTASAAAAGALRRTPGVRAVTPDHPISLTAEILPYSVKRIDAYTSQGGAYQAGYRGNGARIAIVDTGADMDHPDLAPALDAATGKNCLNPAAAPEDGHGHGSHVSGSAAAPLNGLGLVGTAAEAQVVPVKVFDDAGNSSESLVLCGLNHVIGLNADGDPANDVDVISMSFGEARSWGDCATDPLHAAICNASAAGIVLVGGAGNSATNAGSFVPAAFPEVISVSALADFDGNPGRTAGCKFVADLFWTECDDTFAFFSNHGASVDVMAPGVAVYSTWKNGGYSTISGTSMATPHVSGVAALMKAVNPALTGAEVLDMMRVSGECPNGAWADADAVAGCAGQGTWPDDPDGIAEPLVNAVRAAQLADGYVPPPPSPPGAPGLSAAAGDDVVNLSWTAPTSGGAPTGYVVYRGVAPGTATELATLGNVLTYADTSATNGTTFHYQVAATNVAGNGPRSDEVSATPEPPPPVPPAAPALSGNAGNASAELAWTVPADGGSPITGYVVYRGTAPGTAVEVATSTASSFADSGLANDTTYYYQVAAENAAGAGARSNELALPPHVWSQAPQGDWVGNFGADGYLLMAWQDAVDVVSMPLATVTLTQGGRYRWNDGFPTPSLRALENANQTERRPAQWFHSTSLRFNLAFPAAYTGTLRLYALDWDSSSRRQVVTVNDGSGPQAVTLASSFNGGAWLEFPISVAAGGVVTVQADRTAGANATLSGLFLGGPGTPPPLPPQQWEQAPQGDWVGSFGADGHVLMAWQNGTDVVSMPLAATQLTQGGRYRWNDGRTTNQARALENAAQTQRRPAQWFHKTSLRLSLTFTNAYSGTLHLYALDWDSNKRRQTVTVDDGNGVQTVLITSPFRDGAWMHFPISVPAGGVVTVRVDKTNGANATLSGLFLGGS